MITVIKKDDIEKKYSAINDMYRQVWGHPSFSLRTSSQAHVARMRAENEITNDIVKIIHFVYQAQFSTADQISRGTGLNVTDDTMNELYKNLFVNMFVFSDLEDREALNDEEALKIYTLDFNGDYLLSIEAFDMTNWRYTQYFSSIQLVIKALEQTEVLICLLNSKNSVVRRYEQFKEFSDGNKVAKVDAVFSLKNKENGNVINFVSYVIEPGFEDLYFRDNVEILNHIFKETGIWSKYYPDGDLFIPKLLLIIQNSKDINQIKKTANVMGKTTEFVGQELYIVGYNEIIEKGLANADYYTFSTQIDDETSIKKIGIGKMKSTIFK